MIKMITVNPANEYTCRNCQRLFTSEKELRCDPKYPNFCSGDCKDNFHTQKQLNSNGGKQMVSLTERAQSYTQSGKLKNISELKSIPVDIDITEKVFGEGTDKEFKAEVIEVEGEQYKMPVTVISGLKVILEENPNLKTFKVKKVGSGMGTEYHIIPLS